MHKLTDLIYAIELHDADAIRKSFSGGIDPNVVYNNAPLIYELTSEYARSPRFKDCVRAFADHGLIMKDRLFLALLLDDGEFLEQLLVADPHGVATRYTLRCAYTPLIDCTPLHICAEFNHVAAARVLVKYGADVNTTAGHDEFGFGGHTPVFHTVNQNGNQSADMLDFLLEHDADLRLTVPGLVWGKGYPWETLVPAVNPVSYAMFGLLPQFHRDERIISETVTRLLRYGWDIDYTSRNIPNAYLKNKP